MDATPPVALAAATAGRAAAVGSGDAAARYAAVRAHTEALAAPLSEADCQVQSMPDASPVKWHLAHTTWFFETFVLARAEPAAPPFDPAFRVLFNSYYQGVGPQHPRPQRGLLTRPDLARVRTYRAQVDARMRAWLRGGSIDAALAPLVTLGLQHEQQHQELILTDVLHLLSCNPLAPVYRADFPAPPAAADGPPRWHALPGGVVAIGHDGAGFAFDNETPRHRHFLRPCALADRLVTEGEWAAFIADGGYREPRWWLSAGWDWVRAQGIRAPLHWRGDGGDGDGTGWRVFTLAGERDVQPRQPVLHVSYVEADAFARWWSAQHPGQAPARLPTEAEWEHAAATAAPGALAQLTGTAWQWTASSYLPYPGFVAWDGAVGEYNAKFMVDQMVLRGGSLATPPGHARLTYRNFFPATARWQFTGVRLARDEAG